jgi:hypothetical protein
MYVLAGHFLVWCISETLPQQWPSDIQKLLKDLYGCCVHLSALSLGPGLATNLRPSFQGIKLAVNATGLKACVDKFICVPSLQKVDFIILQVNEEVVHVSLHFSYPELFNRIHWTAE